MSTDDTLQIITEFVRQASPQAADGSRRIADLSVDKVFDSIAMIDFLAFLERRFQIRISDAEVLPENFESFASVARLVDHKLGTT